MTKFDVETLGIKKPIEINVTNAVVNKIAKANLEVAKSMDLANKDDKSIMQETIKANEVEKEVLLNILHLGEKEVEHIINTVSSFDLNVWFKNFTTAVFMVRNYGMGPIEMKTLQKKEDKSHHTEKSKSGKTH